MRGDWSLPKLPVHTRRFLSKKTGSLLINMVCHEHGILVIIWWVNLFNPGKLTRCLLPRSAFSTEEELTPCALLTESIYAARQRAGPSGRDENRLIESSPTFDERRRKNMSYAAALKSHTSYARAVQHNLGTQTAPFGRSKQKKVFK
jgi:hypothetical protein